MNLNTNNPNNDINDLFANLNEILRTHPLAQKHKLECRPRDLATLFVVSAPKPNDHVQINVIQRITRDSSGAPIFSERDADGNSIKPFTAHMLITWTHDGLPKNIDQAFEFIQIYSDIVEVAKAFQSAVGEKTWTQFMMTREQTDNSVQEEKNRQLAFARRAAVEAVSHGMRLDSKVRIVPSQLLKNIPNGDHLVQRNNKYFELRVDGEHGSVRRIK